MTDQARKARNAYHREYYRRNKGKVKSYQTNYWEKKAQSTSLDSESINNASSG